MCIEFFSQVPVIWTDMLPAILRYSMQVVIYTCPYSKSLMYNLSFRIYSSVLLLHLVYLRRS